MTIVTPRVPPPLPSAPPTVGGASPSESEGASAVKTHCPYCAFQCGMNVARGPAEALHAGDPERRVTLRVSADPEFPVNRGQMCIKGFTSASLIGHAGRITTPLLRQGGGGAEAPLIPASWDAALDYVAEKLLAIKARYGADALGTFGSGALTNEKVYLLGKFARLALGSANIDYNGRYCMSSGAAGQNKAFGIDRGLPFPVSDIGETDTLLLWGSNVADTMPPMMQWVSAHKDRGGTLIVVDPRKTETAHGAALHLALTPGSDLALANGLLHLALIEGLVDEAYIRERTTGFDEAKRAALAIEPAYVERLTGIPLDVQRRTVRLLANVPRSMVLSGRGPEQQSKGSDTVLALTNLMLALGKVGKPYSGYGTVTGQGNGQGGREHGQKADQLPGYRLIEDPAHRATLARFWGVPEASLPRKGKSAYELLDSMGAPGGVRSLIVFGSNVAVASPNSSHIVERLRALDLLVVCDAFANETSATADAFLPVAQWAEEAGTMTNLEGRVILRQPVQAAPAGARTDLEVLAGLAERLGVGDKFRFASSEAVFTEFAAATAGGKADYSGLSYPKLQAAQGVFWPCPSPEHPGTPRLFAERFFHPDGRAKFYAVPYRPAGELPDREYPLYFTTGRYREHYNSGAQTRQVDALVDAQPKPRVQLHPRLAARLEVGEGDLLHIESRRGTITLAANLTTDLRPDTLFAPFHWGGRQAANVLTKPALDPTSRMPEFKVCAVRAHAAAAAPKEEP